MQATITPAMLKAETFCHLTEEPELVRKAFAFLVPDAGIGSERIYGHYKNPIVKLSFSTPKRQEIAGILSRIAGCEPSIDGNRAVFRLSKFSLLEGRAEEAGEDQAVLVEASFSSFGSGEGLEDYLARRGWE